MILKESLRGCSRGILNCRYIITFYLIGNFIQGALGIEEKFFVVIGFAVIHPAGCGVSYMQTNA